MPLFFNLLNDSDAEIRKQACNALDAVLEGLGDTINQYLPQLIQVFMLLLDNSPTSIKCTVISAIGSAAHAANKVRMTTLALGRLFTQHNCVI
jgi:oligoendopeptidase F